MNTLLEQIENGVTDVVKSISGDDLKNLEEKLKNTTPAWVIPVAKDIFAFSQTSTGQLLINLLIAIPK